jgi:fumarylacetoacetase
VTRPLDETHDPDASSWLTSANSATTDFPIQNLPFGVFTPKGQTQARIGIAIGDNVLDLRACAESGLLAELEETAIGACKSDVLNDLMELHAIQRQQLRKHLFRLLHSSTRSDLQHTLTKMLFRRSEIATKLPAHVGDYTDFYASIFHATNVGRIFRPDNPLLPNYKWVPVGYHGRASSIVISGTPVRRPRGQILPKGESIPTEAPSRLLDYELEVGMYVARGNALGEPIPISSADDHIFGFSLVNDWSARDIQSWEYQPLGPFLGKSFATTVSPWVITMEALAPFRTAAMARAPEDPKPLPYLYNDDDQRSGAIDLTLEVLLSTEKMRASQIPAQRLSLGSFRDMYWTVAQLLAHHTSNGCNLRAGDLLASGTVSGRTSDSCGCLLELTKRGENAIDLPTGEKRAFLEDGDEVTLRGWCEAPGRTRIGFGECVGRIFGQ